MGTFEAGGVPHRTRKLNAYDQFHTLRALEPILPATFALDIGTGALSSETIATTLGNVKPDAIASAFDAAAAAMERQDEDVWGPAHKAVPLPDMIVIVLAVVDANFTAYFGRTRPKFRSTPMPRQTWQPELMPDGESWLFRPSRADPPLIPYLALFDGSVDLFLVAKANDILDVEQENEARAMAAPKAK